MIILNFSHPLTESQLAKIEAITAQPINQVIDVPVQFDSNRSFVPQLAPLLKGIRLSPTEWQTEPIILVLPALNFITAMLIAELHGRMGYFPTFVRITPVEGSLPVRYEVAEIINLQTIRDNARISRQEDTPV